MGQAAQGKTTLVASHVKTAKIHYAWLNLDQSDSDPVNLYHSIIQSLEHELKEPDLSFPLHGFTGKMNPALAISLFREGAKFISKNVPNSTHLVLDGLDRLNHDPLPFQCLQVMMENLSSNIRFIMLSRGTPPLSFEFQHLIIRQEAFILRNEDLAFKQQEVKDFFKKIKIIPLDQNQIRKIYAATEGWVGGLILLSESLRRRSGSSREKFIAQELPDYFNDEIYQYFGKEIFSSQPGEAQQFLLKSSVLEIIEPCFAKELFETENAEEILRTHARENLFVHSFYDEKRGWLFRYHHMFRNFLKAKYFAETTAEERVSLDLKTGNLLKKRGDLENAIKYFLKAKAYPQAIPLMEQYGMELLRTGRKNELASWMDTLPEDLLQKNPWLLLYRTMSKLFRTGKENVFSFQRAYQLFNQNREINGELVSLAQLILTVVQTGLHILSITPLIKKAEALLESIEDEIYPHERATLWYCISHAYILVEGDIRKGLQAAENAYILSKEVRDIPLQAYALVSSAAGFICVGEFSRAEEACRKLETSVQKIDYHKELKAMKAMVHCLLSISQGDFEKARHFSKLLQTVIEESGFVSLAPWVYEITGYLRLIRRDLIDAEQLGKRYLSTARSLENDFLKGLALRLLGLIYLHQKDFKKAREVVDQSVHALSKEAPSRYHLNRVKIISGLICHEIKEIERGEKELTEALQFFSSISSHHSLVETHWCLAFLKWDQKKREEAILHLRTGFKTAEKKKYKYFYLFGRHYLMKACLLALELKIEEPINYMTQLLTLHLSPATEEELKKLSNHSDPAIQNKVGEIRRTIHRSRAPRLRIETLGGFRVFRRDSLIEEKEWDRQQPKQLLKAILSRGMTSIPKEILIEDLWPEEKPKQAENNFKITLQRLRKSLEPNSLNEFGSSYIHLHDNQIRLDHELCQVDIYRFLSLIKQGEEMKKRGEDRKALSFFIGALEIYKGDFLGEDLYSPWTDNKREELRNKYIELLYQTAHLHDRQGSFKKSVDCFIKVIQADPLLEESYQKLMTLYFTKGRYNEALKTYKVCKKVLKKELKTDPDPTTEAIYNMILDKTGAPRTTRQMISIRKK